jgi:hypothetical protein
MRGDEERVVDSFSLFLEAEGWQVEREVDFCDIVAVRGAEKIYAEAKGRTAAIGLDIDTLYGQLLRRMPIAEDPDARFAVVVPEVGRSSATRVPTRVRELLRIDVYTVDENGSVTCIDRDALGG